MGDVRRQKGKKKGPASIEPRLNNFKRREQLANGSSIQLALSTVKQPKGIKTDLLVVSNK